MERFSADKVVSRKLREYLGSSKCTLEYRQKMKSSANRYSEREIPGLYAIIIPSGGGKSTAAREWGFIDIDDVIGNQEVMERLILERREMIRWGTNKWCDHNREWYETVHGVLSKYDFVSNPWVIMVHTEEMAYEIGAEPIAALIPGKKLAEQRLRGRNELERMLAFDNLKIVEHRTKIVEKYYYETWDELEQLLGYLTWDVVELAAPMRGFKKLPAEGWPIGYSDNVPLEIMQGKIYEESDISWIETMYKDGRVPGVCLSYYTEKLYGIRRNDARSCQSIRNWIDLCCEITNSGKMGDVGFYDLTSNDLNEIFPYESKMASNKRLIGLRRLMENIEVSRNDIMMDVLRNRRGSNQNLVVSLLIWIGGVMINLRPIVQEAVLKSKMLLIPDNDWIRVMKKTHDMVRSSGELFGVKLEKHEVQRVMYLHMLYGRFLYDVEEEDEIKKRERELDGKKMSFSEGEWSSEEYDRLEIEGIRDAYKRLADALPYNRIGDFVEFWKNRRNWLAKGSTVLHEGEKKYIVKFVDEVVREMEMRHNKKSLLENPSECESVLSNIIDKIGRNDSKIVPKYESAAKRALLPGNLYHYIVFSYVLWTFENCASIGDVRLGNKRDESFHAFDDKLETNLTRFTYDFSDFNAQHSRKSMARVMSVLSEATDPVETLRFCLNWLKISFSKMEIITKDGEKKAVKSGLYSGWRGTTWINSVLNHTYMYVARVNYMRIFGTDPFVEYEGAGDDVDGVVKDISVAGRLYRITIEMGLESNTLKQMFGKKAEFLRVTYESGYAGASVCRALGNFVSGNWEGEGGTVSDRIAAAIDNIMTLGRRGLDEGMVRALYRCVLAHLGRIFGGEEWLPISPHVLHGTIDSGGLGIPDIDGNIWELTNKAPRPDEWMGYIKLPYRQASKDWSEIIEQKANEYGYKIGDRERLIDILAKDSYDVKSIADRFGGEISPDKWIKYWRFKSNIKNKISVNIDETNENYLFEFIEWLGHERTPILDKIEKLDIIGRYVELMINNEGKKISEEEYYGELFETHIRVDGFSSQLWKPIKCPPLIQSKIGRWCKEIIAFEGLSVFEAQKLFRITCNSYAKMFDVEI